MSFPLSLLSPNGRLLWRFDTANIQTEYSSSPSPPPFCLSCSDLLSPPADHPRSAIPYSLIGFSSIGTPLAIYWSVEEETDQQDDQQPLMVLLDLRQNSDTGGGGTVLSQRKIKLDHQRREARWMGPEHRQYGTGIGRVLGVVLGPNNCAMVGMEAEEPRQEGGQGHQRQRQSQRALLLCVPRYPDSPSWPSEVSLVGLSPSLLAPHSFANSLFFLGRPADNGRDIEPSGAPDKLFFLCRDRVDQRLFAVPVCPLSSSLPFRLLSTSQPSGSPPLPPGDVRLVHHGGRFVAALFRRPDSAGWAVGYLDTKTLQWEGPLMEWESGGEETEGEEAEGTPEVLISADGGVVAVLRTDADGEGVKEIRCFRLPHLRGRSAVPSLSDLVLLSMQCSPAACPLRQSAHSLIAHLGMLFSS